MYQRMPQISVPALYVGQRLALTRSDVMAAADAMCSHRFFKARTTTAVPAAATDSPTDSSTGSSTRFFLAGCRDTRLGAAFAPLPDSSKIDRIAAGCEPTGEKSRPMRMKPPSPPWLGLNISKYLSMGTASMISFTKMPHAAMTDVPFFVPVFLSRHSRILSSFELSSTSSFKSSRQVIVSPISGILFVWALVFRDPPRNSIFTNAPVTDR
mmetsp:Transcript_32884/g.97974  ORF Transcript_32884/g.97974 Transcript_32884/m.97974 type:complete len:211 (+) Transcript_32884:274-906(+)